MGADFKAFEDYLAAGFDENTAKLSIKKNVAATHPLFGFNLPPEYQKSTYLMVDIASAAQGSAVREMIAQNLFQQRQYIPEALKDVPFVGAIPQDMKQLRQLISDAGSKPTLENSGGGVSDRMSSLILLDSRTIHSMGKICMPDASEADLTRYQNLVEHHEASHLMLELDEPGGDFVAAALSLREDPDSRGMLRQWADWRLISGISSGGEVADRYGSECHDAIEHAMSIPPERLRNMSIEELYKIGASYDQNNLRNGGPKQSAEDNVRDSVAEWDVGRGLKFLWNKATSLSLPTGAEIGEHFQTEAVSIQAMRDNLPEQEFARGSKESGIAENLREALVRSPLREMPFARRQ